MSANSVTRNDFSSGEKLSRRFQNAKGEEEGGATMFEIEAKDSVSTDSAFESAFSDTRTIHSDPSSSKDSDDRSRDFQLLRKHETGREKISPFVSSELDEFLTKLGKDRTDNSNAVQRPTSSTDRTRYASTDSNDPSSLRFRRPSPQPLQPCSIGPDASIHAEDLSSTPAAAVSTSSSATVPIRKRHANLPAVIQKYMRMSKKTTSAGGEEPIRGTAFQSENDLSSCDSAPRQTVQTVNSGTKGQAPRNTGKKPRGRPRNATGPSICEESSRPASPSSPPPTLTNNSLEAEDCDADSSCARTAITYPLVKSSPSTDCLNRADPSSSRPGHSDGAIGPASTLQDKTTMFKSLLHSHDLGPHGDLVFVRPSMSDATMTSKSSAPRHKGPLRLFHIQATEPGWKVEKQSIVGAIMRVHQRLRSVQTSISFQQRRWNVDVKLYDSDKDKRFRVVFPRHTLPRGVENNGAEGDVSVVFVKIKSLDSALEVPPEPADSRERECHSPMAGIAIIETKSLCQEKNATPVTTGVETEESTVRPPDLTTLSEEAIPKEKIVWCRRRSIGTQVVTLRHSESQALFLGGQLYALNKLGIHPCDPVAEVEEMMTKQKDIAPREDQVDRAVQSAVNLEMVNCELAETQEKFVSLMGTTADPVPTDLPPPLNLNSPLVANRATQPELGKSSHASLLPVQNNTVPRPPLTIRIPVVKSSPNESAKVRVPDNGGGDAGGSAGNSPEILLVNTGDCHGSTLTKSPVTHHVVADVADQSTAQIPAGAINPNLSNMRINNPGSTVLPVQILPQGLIRLPPGAKVIYNSSAPSQSVSTPIISAVGSLRPLRPVIRASGVQQPRARIPLLFPVGTNVAQPRIPLLQNQRILLLPPNHTGSNPSQARQLNTVLRTYVPPRLPAPSSTLRSQVPAPSSTLRLQVPTPPLAISAALGSQSLSLPSTSQSVNFQIVSTANVPSSSTNLTVIPHTSAESSAQSTSASVSKPAKWEMCNPRIITVSSNDKLQELLGTYTKTLHCKEQRRKQRHQQTLNLDEQLITSNVPPTHPTSIPSTPTQSSLNLNVLSTSATTVTTASPKNDVLVAPLRASSTSLSPTSPFPISLVAKSQMRVIPATSLPSASLSSVATEPSGPVVEAVGSLSKFPKSLSQIVTSNFVPSPTTAVSSATSELSFSLTDPLQAAGRPSVSPDCIAIEDQSTNSPQLDESDKLQIGQTTFSGEKDDPVVLG